MKQGQGMGILDRIIDLFTNTKTDELERIEHLLQGVISEVEPRRDFRKELGERLSQQADDTPVEVERAARTGRPKSGTYSRANEIPWLFTGLVGGLVLIMMAVRLLIYYRDRDRSPQV